MKELDVNVRREVLALVSDVSYALVPDWYANTYRNLKMHLILPKHREGHALQPCLLFLCGGAFSVVNGGIWLPELLYFARRGYTVATIEYRTSNAAQFPAQLIDVKAAVRYLKAHARQFCIDPDRIVISGESAGGALCALAATTAGMQEYEQGDYLEYDSSVAAAVDFYGVVDVDTCPRTESAGGEVHAWTMEAYLGAGYTQADAARASALHHVSPGTPPVMILHGTEDPMVDVTQSDRFYAKLRDSGVYVEYYKLRGVGHGQDAFYQDEVKALVLAFMNKVLGETK
ncbi:MAG: alpha/beta hydrolase [Eubacteriales bacterium]|nr:alpha/beta hydrolase [Eubacteriales bacterium]